MEKSVDEFENYRVLKYGSFEKRLPTGFLGSGHSTGQSLPTYEQSQNPGHQPIQSIPKPSISKSGTMTPEQLEYENFEMYNAIFERGIAEERKRVSGWLKAEIANKWELRTGILSGEPVETHGKAELDDFYGDVDAKLKGTQAPDNKVHIESPKSKGNDIYAQMEASEFYEGVDKMSKTR